MDSADHRPLRRNPALSTENLRSHVSAVGLESVPLRETLGRNAKNPRFPGGFVCARYWDRTSDLFRVREARYRCANRAY